MKEKHIRTRMEQCLTLAKTSNCPRQKVGAILLDPIRNIILMDGYNGGPRDGGELCGGDCCLRDKLKIPSGTNQEVGCVHAEINAVCNSAFSGVKTAGSWLIINVIPCLMCAKVIHHAGIVKVIAIAKSYPSEEGIKYLLANGVVVEYR